MQYKVTFFDCYDIFNVSTFHNFHRAKNVIESAAVQIVTLNLAPSIRLYCNGTLCNCSAVDNYLTKCIEKIEKGYINKYFDDMEKAGRL